MSQVKRFFYIGVVILIIIGVLVYIWIPSFVFDITRFSIPAQLNSNPVTQGDLINHFARVTEFTLNTITTVITLFGALGLVASYFSFKTFRDMQNFVNDNRQKVTILENEMQKLKDELQEAAEFSSVANNRLRFFLEARDRNPEVRIRAAQQLGMSNDIAAISILSEMIESDRDENVRVEAAYGLGRLLVGVDSVTLEEGIKALLVGTQDEFHSVRLETIEALDTLVSNGVELPRTVYRRIEELIKHDKIKDVVEAAKAALEHIKQQREK